MLPQRFYDIQFLETHPRIGNQRLPQIRIDYRHLEGALTISLVTRNAHGVFVPVPSKAGPLPFDVVVFNSPTGVIPPHISQDAGDGICFFEVVVGLLSPVGIWIREDIQGLKFNRNLPAPPGWNISDRHILILKPQQKHFGTANGALTGGNGY
ncbi:hypothetical protein FS749_000579 [Ceratobasidium sp. UAMH 11750]|nr:hypothetical protein FS749_000579 [Ceratobasidium sp. UAMH 11750]